MAKALNFGRVSGLAVALGVGAVIAANPAVAYAENGESDSSAGRSDSSASDDTNDTDPADTDTKDADADAGDDSDDDDGRPLSRLIRNLTPSLSDRDKDEDEDEEGPRRPGNRVEAEPDDVASTEIDDSSETTVDLSSDGSEPTEPADDLALVVDDVDESTSTPVFSEAAIVERVQQLFAALPSPELDTDDEPEAPSAPEPLLALALSTLARRPESQPVDEVALSDERTADAQIAAAAQPYDPNPFRADDPIDPAIPDFVYNIMAGVQGYVPDEFDPIAREAVEATFRVSQMIPWVNFPVPALTIVELLEGALSGDKAATQRIIEQLILTVPVAGVAYWGYDQVADTLNVEAEGAALKRGAIDLAWDTIDFGHLLHP